MRRWLTWRARLEHLLFPEFECMCVVCEATRDENTRLKLELRQAQQRALIPRNPVPLAQGGPVMGPPHTSVQIGPPFVWREKRHDPQSHTET
jgi:hypothetical protein